MAEIRNDTAASARDDPVAVKKKPEQHGGLTDLEIVDGKKSKSGIILRPQPTNDPNEPLVGLHVLLPYTPISFLPDRTLIGASRTGRNGRSTQRTWRFAGLRSLLS
jgi:hypothetical protein